MQDNGLLSLFNKQAKNNGYIDVDSFNGFVYQNANVCRVTKFYYPKNNRTYFLKPVNPFEKDAEILLSQLYAKAGIKTCTYLPSNNGRSVVCENIKDDSTFTPEELLKSSTDIGRSVAYDAFPGKLRPEGTKIAKYFSKEAIRDYLKMQLFDTATFNIDRNLGNYMLKVGDDSKVEEVKSYDYGSSGHLLGWMWGKAKVDPKDKNFNSEQWYSNGLGAEGFKSRFEMIDEFRENETINHFLPVEDAAKSLREINVQEVCEDIRDTIGYKISSTYADSIEALIDDTATRLEQ